MSDVIDVIYRLREAQAVLDRLDKFADDAQDVAELAAASDLFPTHSALLPERAGLVHAEKPEAS